MDTQDVRHPLMELGLFSIVVPVVWVVAAFVGFALLVNRPELFADPMHEQAGASAMSAAPAVIQVGGDASAIVRTSVSSGAQVSQGGEIADFRKARPGNAIERKFP